jgi:hypothetical protein
VIHHSARRAPCSVPGMDQSPIANIPGTKVQSRARVGDLASHQDPVRVHSNHPIQIEVSDVLCSATHNYDESLVPSAQNNSRFITYVSHRRTQSRGRRAGHNTKWMTPAVGPSVKLLRPALTCFFHHQSTRHSHLQRRATLMHVIIAF